MKIFGKFEDNEIHGTIMLFIHFVLICSLTIIIQNMQQNAFSVRYIPVHMLEN